LQGDFSFDALFGGLVNELLPNFTEEESDSAEGGDSVPNGNLRNIPGAVTGGVPLFPAVDELLALFKQSCKELVDLRSQVYFSFLFYLFILCSMFKQKKIPDSLCSSCCTVY
jgi:exocyst complex component 5